MHVGLVQVGKLLANHACCHVNRVNVFTLKSFDNDFDGTNSNEW